MEGHYAEAFDCSRRGSKHRCGGNSNLKQRGSLAGRLGLGSRSCGWRSHCRCCRRKRNRVAAVLLLPVWLLRIRTTSLLWTALRPRVERLRLGACLLVTCREPPVLLYEPAALLCKLMRPRPAYIRPRCGFASCGI